MYMHNYAYIPFEMNDLEPPKAGAPGPQHQRFFHPRLPIHFRHLIINDLFN